MSYNDYKYGIMYDDDDDEKSEKDNKLSSVLIKSKTKKVKFTDDIKKDFKFGNINILSASDGSDGYLSAYSYSDFISYKFSKIFGCVPDIIHFNDIYINKFIHDLFKYVDIPISSYIKNINKDEKISLHTIALYFKSETNNPIILLIDEMECNIFYENISEEIEGTFIDLLISLISGYKEPKVSKNKIYVVYKGEHGFDKMGFDIKKVDIKLDENYNDDFPEVFNEIVTGLNKKNKTNLVILSGSPGTGKTSLIRHMAGKLKKNIIFISPDMVNYITDPSFIPFLMKNNDSILIIEDAEPALESRELGRTGAVSNVLNLTDGLLSDCLNISILATFNTDTKNIDTALLRKGRLLKHYKFEKLAIDKSKKLLTKLGHPDAVVSNPMSLAEIYYYEGNNNAEDFTKKKKVGFF